MVYLQEIRTVIYGIGHSDYTTHVCIRFWSIVIANAAEQLPHIQTLILWKANAICEYLYGVSFLTYFNLSIIQNNTMKFMHIFDSKQLPYLHDQNV